MSTQVKRRREAATFLSTFVGAQAEVLADTTNYRLQLHDGSTLGGWPHARIADLSGRNALINGNFMINQRGQASGAALAVNAYGHDRWKGGASGCTYTFAQAANDTTITITAGSLVQVIEGANVCETSYVLSWTGTAQARAYQSSAGSFSIGTSTTTGLDGQKNYLLVTGLSIGTAVTVEFSTGTVATVQFETTLPNAGPSNFERRQYAQELLLCQRYFQTFGGNNPFEMFGSGVAYSTSQAIFFCQMVTAMRATPTLTLSAASAFQLVVAGGTALISAIAAYAVTKSSISLTTTPSASIVAGQAVLLRANSTTSCNITMSAEI